MVLAFFWPPFFLASWIWRFRSRWALLGLGLLLDLALAGLLLAGLAVLGDGLWPGLLGLADLPEVGLVQDQVLDGGEDALGQPVEGQGRGRV